MRKYLYFLTSSLVASLVVAPAVMAQEAQDEAQLEQNEDEVEVETVVFSPRVPDRLITITATGLLGRVGNTGQPVTVLDRDEIDSVQGADIARVLQRVPSVSLTRNGSIGGFSGLNVRGANGEQVLVLIDGVRVSDPAAPGGGFDFGNLLASSTSKIDLLRGSNSVIWGSDALGGVIDISARDPDAYAKDFASEAMLEYGARDTLTAQGGVSGSFGPINADLGASWFQTDGFSSAASGTEADGFEQLALNGQLSTDLTGDLQLFAQARYAEGDLEIDGFPAPTFALADTLDTQETTQYSGAVGLNYYGNDLSAIATFSLADTERVNLNGDGGETFASNGESERLELRAEYRLIGGLKLNFGGSHEWSRFDTLFDTGADTQSTGIYGQIGWVLGDLALHAGGRFDDHEGFGSAFSLGGDVSYGFADDWRVRASFGEGFKAPSLFQLFSDFGNEALDAETTTSFDLGVERGARGGNGLHLAATVFRRDSENLIGFVSCFGSTDAICDNRPFGTFDNTDRARAQGIELEAGFTPFDGLRLAGHYSLVDTQDRGSGANAGNELARRPSELATLFADYDTGFGLSLGADLRIVGSAFENATNTTALDGYEVFDLRASFDITDEIALFGRVENVFDADYQTAAGFASAGRGAFLGVRAGL